MNYLYVLTLFFSFLMCCVSRPKINSGDIIYEVNGKEVNGTRSIFDAVGIEAGKTIELKLHRPSGGDLTVTLTTEIK